MTDRHKDPAFYGPLIGLPLIVCFFSAVGNEIGLVVVASVVSVIAIALLGLIRCLDKFSYVYLVAATLVALFISSIGLTHWPLRVTFAMARKQLDGIADRRCGGSSYDLFERAGVFTISSAVGDDSGACRLPTVRSYSQVEFVRLRGDANIDQLDTVSQLKLADDWYFVEIAMPSYDDALR
jgi:hypothetical protein